MLPESRGLCRVLPQLLLSKGGRNLSAQQKVMKVLVLRKVLKVPVLLLKGILCYRGEASTFGLTMTTSNVRCFAQYVRTTKECFCHIRLEQF